VTMQDSRDSVSEGEKMQTVVVKMICEEKYWLQGTYALCGA